MSNRLKIANQFFESCETGKGWDACKNYCHPNATFSAQTTALAEINTLEAYTDWMKGLLTSIPDGSYDLKFFAEDKKRDCVAAFAVFRGTNTGSGGPEPTGKTAEADYVYVMKFEGDLIKHMTKIWNDTITLQQLGWA